MEPHPGCGPLLAPVADNHPAGDSVALHHFPHAGAQLPYVSPIKAVTSLPINSLCTYARSCKFHPALHAEIISSWSCCAAAEV